MKRAVVPKQAAVLKRAIALIASILTLGLGTSAAIATPGELGTMPTGRYICELPGDGSGPASLHVPESDFTILRASRYRAHYGAGIYLLTGDLLVLTSGPRQGERFIRKSNGFLRMLGPNDEESLLRCVLQNRNNR